MFGANTPFGEWAATFRGQGATCEPGHDWSSMQSGKTIEEALLNADGDPSFRATWAAWAVVEYDALLDARVRELLLGLVCNHPVVAALLLKRHWSILSDGEKQQCLRAFHPDYVLSGTALVAWRTDGTIQRIIEQEITRG